MKALVLESNGNLVVSERVVPPAPCDPSLLVRVAACGICGSDIPRAFDNAAYHHPLVMGHELSAIVEESCTGSRFKAGDRVAVFPLLPCKKCRHCQTGDYAQCSSYDYYGSRRDGGFEEYLRVPDANLFRIPDGVDIIHASMTEPAAVALHGVRKMRISAGDSAVVFGGGPIGNMTAQWLRIHGCSPVIVVDVDPVKLKIAQDMGFTTVNPKEGDPVAAIKALTGGDGALRVVEACGLPSTFLQALQCAAYFAEVVFMGNIHGTFQVGEKDFSSILRRELVIHGTWNSKVTPQGTNDWETVLSFMGKQLVLGPLISDTPSLDEGPEIFESIRSRKRFHNKVIFKI